MPSSGLQDVLKSL